jgi:hypothetical protein
MRRWLRPLGLLASTLFIVGVVLVAVLGGGDDLDTGGPPPDLRNGRVFIQDNLWTANGRQYAVWVAPDGTPYAGVRDRDGRWKAVDLGRLKGNPLAAPTADDDHNVYAIGVDADGGVHVAGNMHGDPLRFVNADGELGDWGRGALPRPGDDVTYPALAALPDGALLFFRREGSPLTGGEIELDVLRPGEEAWQSLGTILDGRPTGDSPYIHHVAINPRTGAIHLLFEWRSGETFTANQDVQYMRSVDGGRSWQRSDGEALPSPVTRQTAETVIATPPGSGLLNGGGLTVDAAGAPHGSVSFTRPTGDSAVEHVWLTDEGWQRVEVDGADLDGRSQVAGTPDGRVWLLGVRGVTLVAIDISPDRDPAETREIARVPAGWEPNFDSQALAERGVVQMLIPRGREPYVVTADLEP